MGCTSTNLTVIMKASSGSGQSSCRAVWLIWAKQVDRSTADVLCLVSSPRGTSLSICTARCTRARATLYVFCSQEGMAGWNQRWKPSRARTPSLGKVGASAGCGSSSTLRLLRARGPRATYLSEGAGPSWQSSFRMM